MYGRWKGVAGGKPPPFTYLYTTMTPREISERRKMRKRKRSKRLEIAKQMPPLYHTLPNKDFDIRKSEVVKWLISQPEIMQYIFSHLKDIGFIAYNQATKKWEGVNGK